MKSLIARRSQWRWSHWPTQQHTKAFQIGMHLKMPRENEINIFIIGVIVYTFIARLSVAFCPCCKKCVCV